VSESQRRRAADLGRLSFNQRRKKALKVLASRYDRVTLENAFREAEIDVNSRPEEISPEQFLVLARRLA